MKALRTLMYDYSEPGVFGLSSGKNGSSQKKPEEALGKPYKTRTRDASPSTPRAKKSIPSPYFPSRESGLWIHVAIPLRAKRAGIFRSLRIDGETVNFIQRRGG